MQICYTLGKVELDKSEANFLFALSDSDAVIHVDLKKHVTGVTSQSLFEKAVEDQDARLATLAAKFAMEGSKKFNKKKGEQKTKGDS